MSNCTITFEPDASDADQLVVQNGLRAFNTSMTAQMNRRPIVFFLRDENRTIQGGLVGQLIWDSLDVKWLWVADAYRGKGHGSAMLLAAEDQARKGGCEFATLDTFSYQARPFYEKLGYHPFATVQGFPGGYERHYMKKRLLRADKPKAQSTGYAATLDDIHAAARRIAPYAHHTPVMTCATLDAMAERKLFFKCEQFQKVGAFKFRGACNAVMKLTDAQAARGVVTHSSGNHAQALALAARLRGIAAHIVMPRTAAAIKREAVRGYGATVYECEPNTQAREGTAADVQKRTGATLIHPYDNADIIAGQGTAAMELLDECPDLEAIIAPVGGGGLLSGTAIASRGLKPGIRVFAGEPAGAGDAAQSKSQGRIVPMEQPNTIADGLLTSLGERTWPVVRDLVERIFTVTEPQIIAAMRLAWERAKLLIEPSSAVVIAAVLSDEFKAVRGVERIGLILSGGNVSLDKLPW